MSLSSHDIKQSTKLFELGPAKFVSYATLEALLPDVETALFFARAYDLDYTKLSLLMKELFKSTVIAELMQGYHSLMLQDYLVDIVPDYMYSELEPNYVDRPPHAEILPQLWESLELVVANSIKEVADKLSGVLDLLPGKQGQMVFNHMAKLNRQRPTIGVYQAGVHHAPVVENLVIFDVSGSMSEQTVARLVNDVVALSWKANAHLAIVSDSAFYWEPGTYNVTDVLARAEYGGTHYEMLTPLLQRDWGTVITIADYDSSLAAAHHIKFNARGRIDTILDISLVNQPTFLAKALAPLARELRPILIGSSYYVLS